MRLGLRRVRTEAAAPARRSSRGVVELPATLVTVIVPFESENVIDISCLTKRMDTAERSSTSTFPEGRDSVFLGAPGPTAFERSDSRVPSASCPSRKGGTRRRRDSRLAEWTEAGSEVESRARRQPVV